MGQAAQARVRDRLGTLLELRRRVEDRRRHPGAAGDRGDPHAPGAAGPCAATLTRPRSSTSSGLTIQIHRSRSSSGPGPGTRGLAVRGLVDAAALGSSHQGKPTAQAAGVRFRPGSTALGRSPSTTKTHHVPRPMALATPIAAPAPPKSAFERPILQSPGPVGSGRNRACSSSIPPRNRPGEVSNSGDCECKNQAGKPAFMRVAGELQGRLLGSVGGFDHGPTDADSACKPNVPSEVIANACHTASHSASNSYRLRQPTAAIDSRYA